MAVAYKQAVKRSHYIDSPDPLNSIICRTQLFF